MKRSCSCDKPTCHLCRLYNTDPRYMRAEGGIRSFALAMLDEGKWRADGGAAPTEAERARRRELCNGCDKRDASNDSCTLCGCYLEAGFLPPRPLGKLDCSTQRCPLGIWDFAGGYTAASVSTPT